MWRRLLCSLRAKPPGGGAAGLSCARLVGPIRLHEGEPPRPAQEATQSGKSWHGRHQQHKGFGCGKLLHRCIPLDAFTWSALAVLALELAKQLPWLSSLKVGGGNTGFRKWYGQLAGVPSLEQSVLPSTSSTCSSGEKEFHFLGGEDTNQALENPSCSKAAWPEDCLSETGDFLLQPSTGSGSNSCLLQEESLTEVASEVQQVFQDSISVAFNILGLELMQDGQRKMAFSCFKLAADQNYSKAQFNVGLCYEHGRGTEKDMAKAILYYQRAAHQGHTMAKYRYAKWILDHWPKADNDCTVQEAVSLLDQAAAAGLTQAQTYLRAFYLKNLEPGKKSLQEYMHVAAKKGDSPNKLHLGVGCEKEFGVTQNLLSSGKHFQKAAAEDYRPAQERMKMAQETIAALQSGPKLPLTRAISSSPCLQSLNQPLFSHLGQTAFSLLHSWSTGNLREVTKSCTNYMPSPAFPDGLSLKRQPLVWSPVG
ncbi:death ligand signal enhancer [Tiliqua scincoides]|uniref:death ligand signal enhancer n=1 Tax=Tiliqua scincoides TaxID=71010 RepID=UPI00346196C2